jgi:DNA repair exonuclease SbcCD ATPase subunit
LENLKADLEQKKQNKNLKEQMMQETISRVEMLEIDIANYEKQNPNIIEKYTSKATLEKELSGLKAKIKQMQLDVDSMDERRVTKQMIIDSAQSSINEQKERIKAFKKAIGELENQDIESIKRIEVYFNRKHREVGIDTPIQIIQTSLKRMDEVSLSSEIFAKQAEVLANLKSSLLDNVHRTIEVLEKEISEKAIDVKHVGETLKIQLKHHDPNNENAVKMRDALINKFKLL